MNLFIYFKETNIDLDLLEDEFDFHLSKYGEVTGSGKGQTGGNLDIEIYHMNQEQDVLKIIYRILIKWELNSSTVIDINGKKRILLKDLEELL